MFVLMFLFSIYLGTELVDFRFCTFSTFKRYFENAFIIGPNDLYPYCNEPKLLILINTRCYNFFASLVWNSILKILMCVDIFPQDCGNWQWNLLFWHLFKFFPYFTILLCFYHTWVFIIFLIQFPCDTCFKCLLPVCVLSLYFVLNILHEQRFKFWSREINPSTPL